MRKKFTVIKINSQKRDFSLKNVSLPGQLHKSLLYIQKMLHRSLNLSIILSISAVSLVTSQNLSTFSIKLTEISNDLHVSEQKIAEMAKNAILELQKVISNETSSSLLQDLLSQLQNLATIDSHVHYNNNITCDSINDSISSINFNIFKLQKNYFAAFSNRSLLYSQNYKVYYWWLSNSIESESDQIIYQIITHVNDIIDEFYNYGWLIWRSIAMQTSIVGSLNLYKKKNCECQMEAGNSSTLGKS